MPQPSLPTLRPPWTFDALHVIARHRFVTMRQLAAALDTDEADVVEGLKTLVADRLLVTLRPTGSLAEPEVELAYLLTRRGAALYASEMDTVIPTVPDRRKSSLTLAHELGITELAIALERLHSAGVLELLHWDTSRERIAVSAGVVTRDGFERIPLVADAYAVIRRGHETHAFLVEIDRGTVATARMRTKYLGYLAWRRLDGPEARFGVRAMRVLTIGPSVSRLERLREVARHASVGSGTGFLWFALAADIRADDPARLLGPIWKVVRQEPDPVSLFRADTVTDTEGDSEREDDDPSSSLAA